MSRYASLVILLAAASCSKAISSPPAGAADSTQLLPTVDPPAPGPGETYFRAARAINVEILRMRQESTQNHAARIRIVRAALAAGSHAERHAQANDS